MINIIHNAILHGATIDERTQVSIILELPDFDLSVFGAVFVLPSGSADGMTSPAGGRVGCLP